MIQFFCTPQDFAVKTKKGWEMWTQPGLILEDDNSPDADPMEFYMMDEPVRKGKLGTCTGNMEFLREFFESGEYITWLEQQMSGDLNTVKITEV